MLRLRCRRWPEPQCASESELWPYGAVGGFPPPVRKKMRWEAPTMRAPVVILRSRRISYWRRLGLTIRCPWLASRPASRRIRHRAPPAMSRRSLPPRQARPRRGAASRRQERSSSRLIGQREDRHPCGPAVRLDNRVLHPTGDRDVLNAGLRTWSLARDQREQAHSQLAWIVTSMLFNPAKPPSWPRMSTTW